LQIICTTNLRLDQIDAAVMRPGRLVAVRHFRALTGDEAKVLAASVHRDWNHDGAATLAEVFAGGPQRLPAPRPRRIGFGAGTLPCETEAA
jgi:hypothetical protein